MDLPEHRLECVRGPARCGGDEKHPIAPRPPTPPRFLSALTTAAGRRGRSPRAHPRPTAGLPGESPRLPHRRLESRWQDPRRGAGRPPRRARRFLSASAGRAGGRVAGAGRARESADAPLTLGSGPTRRQQQRGQKRQEQRARPAAARPVHSSSRGGGGGGSQAARRTSTGSARRPGHLVPAALPTGCRGRLRSSLFPLTCSFASARPLRTP